MGKKFVGLDGLKHFWTKAKSWITAQITSEVTAKIAELVANAPEDLNTLKEIADWIKNHANDASAMNTQINTNKSDISALKTSVAGKADTGHTHTKSQITDFPTSLPANGGSANIATTAAKLGRNGNTGLPMTFNWSGQGGQPSWLWGGNDGSNMYVYNPSNFNVNSATTAYKIRIGNSNPTDGDIWIQ